MEWRWERVRLKLVDARPSAWRTVAAATALNAPFGSLYAFSVFLQPLETMLGVGRADLALVFALAACGFGAGMILAPTAYGLAPTPLVVLVCASASTLGIGLAATANGLGPIGLVGSSNAASSGATRVWVTIATAPAMMAPAWLRNARQMRLPSSPSGTGSCSAPVVVPATSSCSRW